MISATTATTTPSTQPTQTTSTSTTQPAFVVLSDVDISVVDPTKPIYNGNCWKRAYGRGIGKPIHTCPVGYEKQGLLCYPVC